MLKKIEEFVVIGGGLMGAGIAQVKIFIPKFILILATVRFNMPKFFYFIFTHDRLEHKLVIR